jgi:hypothetical protein
MRNPESNSDTYPDRMVYGFMTLLVMVIFGLSVYFWLLSLGEFMYRFRWQPWGPPGVGLYAPVALQQPNEPFRPEIPKTFDDKAVASSQVSLAVAEVSPVQIDSRSYYNEAVRPIYRSYPVYHPGKEPGEYFEGLRRQEPEIAFDPARLKTKDDWIKAGELVFDAPLIIEGAPLSEYLRDPKWYEATRAPLAADGTLPFYRYVVREKGKVEVATFSCGMCHTRVMNAAVVKGAQGNMPFGRANSWESAHRPAQTPEQAAAGLLFGRAFLRNLFAAPWITRDPLPLDELSEKDFAALNDGTPPGVFARHGTSPASPSRIPDLIGLKERRYLDATGLARHRDIGDLMRYAAINQDTDFVARYGDFVPLNEMTKVLPPGAPQDPPMRYSDEQLYALSLYLYSLEPPPNPNKFDDLARRGEAIFQREACAGCHTPPLYTNNKLTPAVGFTPPEDHSRKYDILQPSVGTDPDLALKTRRGTGYYKVPSLKGVWYRGPFEHNGSVATLEDWFDPRRLHDDYVPTGFIGLGMKTRAVKGHEYGLDLTPEEKRALIAFLKTL